ncbi:secreted protein containing Outer membrane protein, OmpA/MotB [gut metagenome]|uniref:Secreted protein containing Outer membrane protein, OmpA/MotB n=1 Tax=gut metagenome TaxID=749906 RepID=J9H3Q3_9ZZZZ
MKKIYTLLIGGMLLGASGNTQAQTLPENTGKVTVSEVTIHWEPSLDIRMQLNLDSLQVQAEEAVEIIPLLVASPDTLELPRVLVTGRARHILYERNPKSQPQGYQQVVRRKNGTSQTLDYRTDVPTESWMDGAQLLLMTDLCGCGWKSVAPAQQQEVALLEAPKNPVFEPMLAFIVPSHEAVKMREKSGQAFLDFPVNKITIYPDYRNNPRELKKIQETIRSVREDPYATITQVSIEGFASPEGSYASNERLARKRAEALLTYVKGLYAFEGVKFDVSSVPEDWAGLDSLVRTSTLDEKEALLGIIRDTKIANPDTRDWKLKQLAGGQPYRHLLKEFYPALRHSDYKVSYQIRHFTVEEAKELIYTQPSKLSLEEMFLVAQTYEAGSPEFNEVFEIAVRMYPNDPVSNLNAANTALLRKDAEAARRYLQKAQPGPEKEQAEKALVELEKYLKEIQKIAQ